jgi:aminoglycoside 6'-N-acetyltransferase
LARSDFEALSRWFAEHHVRAWFNDTPTALDDLEAKYGPRIDGREATQVYIIEMDGQPAGFIQAAPADQYAVWPSGFGLVEAVALDGLFGEPALLGRGRATEVLRQFLAAAPGGFGGATKVIGETARANVPMCLTLERVGFECIYEGDLERDGKRDRRVYVYSLESVPGTGAG